eukprot:15446024-Alexandrium_andersonii.AAC.1
MTSPRLPLPRGVPPLLPRGIPAAVAFPGRLRPPGRPEKRLRHGRRHESFRGGIRGRFRGRAVQVSST